VFEKLALEMKQLLVFVLRTSSVSTTVKLLSLPDERYLESMKSFR
jgi:hypothetical protein